MKAMQYLGYGLDRLVPSEVPAPRPAPDQLLVRVRASSVNPVDWKVHAGHYRLVMPIRFPSIPGRDVAGEVAETGARVTRFQPGERVFAMLDRLPGGASAEYAVVAEGAAARAPAGLGWLEAACLPLAGLTALQALRDLGRIAAGQRVLIIGAAGGVGHLAVQIAKVFEARVTAVASAPRADMLRDLGADEVVDYARRPELGDPGSFDLVLDLVVNRPVRALLALLAPAGVCVPVLPSAGRIAAAAALPLVSKRRVRIVSVKPSGSDLELLRSWCEHGKLRPVIERVYPLQELADAHRCSRNGHVAGKLAIQVS